MAIVNRTPDSFYDKGSTYAADAALDAVDRAVAEGADIVDIGGVKAGPGQEVDVAEELRRVAGFVAAVRERAPDVVISVDTWRHEVGEAVAAEGADLLNDAWGGTDPLLAEVAARHDLGLVCTHAGGQAPRTRPHRKEYVDVMADVVARTTALAERAVSLGVDRDRILVDPGHDFVKSTRHSLEVTRRLDELAATGWPCSSRSPASSSSGRPERPDPRPAVGTLATTAVSAWPGHASSGCTTSPSPARRWTWWPRCGAPGRRRWPVGGWLDRDPRTTGPARTSLRP
jgi:dihydropteroate synthase